MLGAHFDSWHAGTGATDNAAGSAVMMEAMRILKATRPAACVERCASGCGPGEEQGLLGSRAYVDEHFARSPDDGARSPRTPKLSAYFNWTTAPGRSAACICRATRRRADLRGVDATVLKNLGMTTVAIRNTGGTDHLAFDAVGLPGFQFIQDPIEYHAARTTRTWTSTIALQASDMMQNAVIVAAFAYHAANRDQLLPRKPMPKPAPRASGGA